MNLDEAVTVAKINVQGDKFYLMIGWQSNSFEMYLYNKEKIWNGRFSTNRLVGFSKKLHLPQAKYVESVKRCLSQPKDDYSYELENGFFYWKRKIKDSFTIEGFLPVELDTSKQEVQPDLVEILLALNSYLKEKVNSLSSKFKTIKSDYQKCLKDTEEFLNLKVEMEKALCEKFLDLIQIKKTKVAGVLDTGI